MMLPPSSLTANVIGRFSLVTQARVPVEPSEAEIRVSEILLDRAWKATKTYQLVMEHTCGKASVRARRKNNRTP